MSLSEYLRRVFRPGTENRDDGVKISQDMLPEIIQSLEDTEIEEYSCDQVYMLLDQFAETINRGEDASKLMPLVERHLDMCGDCREEFDALLSILHAQNAS